MAGGRAGVSGRDETRAPRRRAGASGEAGRGHPGGRPGPPGEAGRGGAPGETGAETLAANRHHRERQTDHRYPGSGEVRVLRGPGPEFRCACAGPGRPRGRASVGGAGEPGCRRHARGTGPPAAAGMRSVSTGRTGRSGRTGRTDRADRTNRAAGTDGRHGGTARTAPTAERAARTAEPAGCRRAQWRHPGPPARRRVTSRVVPCSCGRRATGVASSSPRCPRSSRSRGSSPR